MSYLEYKDNILFCTRIRACIFLHSIWTNTFSTDSLNIQSVVELSSGFIKSCSTASTWTDWSCEIKFDQLSMSLFAKIDFSSQAFNLKKKNLFGMI